MIRNKRWLFENIGDDIFRNLRALFYALLLIGFGVLLRPHIDEKIGLHHYGNTVFNITNEYNSSLVCKLPGGGAE